MAIHTALVDKRRDPPIVWVLLADAARSPLGQALILAAAIGTFLYAFAPSWGLRDTFRGSPVDTRPAPAFSLTDQSGQPISMDDLQGGAVVLTFIYTNCTFDCPLTTARLAQTVRLLGNDARTANFVAITVDPQRDTQEALRAYANRFGLNERARFLTGPPDVVASVVSAYHAEPVAAAAAEAVSSVGAADGFGAPLPRPGDIVHPSVVLLIDGQGFERFAYGPGFNSEDLAHDIRLLQADLTGPVESFPLY